MPETPLLPEFVAQFSTDASAAELIAGLSALEMDRITKQPTLLTSRESLVLGELADGKTNKAIAHSLGVSLETVKSHLRNLYEKLGASDRLSALTGAVRQGLLKLD